MSLLKPTVTTFPSRFGRHRDSFGVLDGCEDRKIRAERPRWKGVNMDADNIRPDRDWCTSPGIISHGRLEMHSRRLPTGAACLDGQWYFRHWFGEPPEPHFQTLVNQDDVAMVEVPGSWVVQGYGIPIYTNIDYPFSIEEYPAISLEPEGGDYVTSITPSFSDEEQVILRVGAAEAALEVWIDDQLVGVSTDSRLPAEFDVTNFVSPGQRSILGLRVHRWAAASWLEGQDMWWMAGLHRSIYLYTKPKSGIRDYFFTTDELNGDTAVIGAEFEFETSDASEDFFGEDTELRVSFESTDRQTHVFRSGLADVHEARVWRTFEISDVLSWTAETPNLYQVTIELLKGQEVLDQTTFQYGIRTVRVEAGCLLVNGTPITIFGVNRHEHDPVRGRYQDDEQLRADLELIAASNINAIRTSHYPNDERFYELCDQIGLYVVDEANLETHGLVIHGECLPANDPEFTDSFVTRGSRMVRRDRNHPCVIIWSFGNESGWGINLASEAAEIARLDPSRPTIYHPAELDPMVDIISPMYPSQSEIEQLVSLPDERPVLICEYSHAMGNSNGGLTEYWQLIHAHPRLIGGFIWDWVDQSLERQSPSGQRWWAYGGDFGDETTDRNFNCNGLVDPDRNPHPSLRHIAWVYRPVEVSWSNQPGTVEILNRRSHAGLSDLTLEWEVYVSGECLYRQIVDQVHVPPGGRAKQRVEIPEGVSLDGRYPNIRFSWRDADDRLVAWDELALPYGRQKRPSLPAADTALCGYRETDFGWELHASSAALRLDQHGLPLRFIWGRETWPVSWSRLGVWRPPTDNDAATFGPERMALRYRQTGLDTAELELRSDPVVSTSDDGVVSALFPLKQTEALWLDLAWMCAPNGDIGFDLVARGQRDLIALARVGLELELPGRLSRLDWFGPGPEESYPDRVGGLYTGHHSVLVKQNVFPYARPQESGNHTHVQWAALSASEGTGILAIGDPMFDTCATNIRPDDLAAASHVHEIKTIDATIWRLDAAHGGLGTASCGPGVLAQHKVDPYHSGNRIILRPTVPGADLEETSSEPSPLTRQHRWRYPDTKDWEI